MANNVKTPVMVLQELTVKRGIKTPEYSIIHAKQGTHDNEFHYQVVVATVSAVGIGRSKQVAKHDAARKALDILEEVGLYNPDETVVKAPRSEIPNSPIRQSINSIGSLGEMCVENKIPMPTFTEISDVGPPHCKEFTYECKIASIITRATAGTKKQAKQLAAKEMIERISHVLPELVAECNESISNAITDKNSEAVEKYTELKKFTKPKPNLAVKVQDHDSNFQLLMEAKNITYEDLTVFFEGPYNKETLKALLDKLELDYMLQILQETPPIVALSLNTDVPFCVLADGDTFEQAIQNSIAKTFEHIQMFSK